MNADEVPSGLPEFTREDFVRVKQARKILADLKALLPRCGDADVECQYFTEETARRDAELAAIEDYFFAGSGWQLEPGEVRGAEVLGPIFTARHHAQLKQAERVLHDLLPTLDKIEACGEDCDMFRVQTAAAAAKLAAIERAFMSPVPPT